MKRLVMISLLLCCMLLSACAAAQNEEIKEKDTPVPAKAATGIKPELPEKLETNDDGVPLLQVYQVDEEQTMEMNIENYLEGVLAGEMKNDWPIEALKAQAILARTFVLKFCSEKESKYEGADISTDIEEAQAYDATGINERIVQAVQETRGMVLSHSGELPYAWFHAHSGGMTAMALEGLGYDKEEPGYIQVLEGKDSPDAPSDAAAWEATFSEAEFIAAVKECGVQVDAVESIEVGTRGKSGRATTILVNSQEVDASQLRIALGSTKMRSTLLTSLKLDAGRVSMAGKGFGHGVGMPQWGAYAMAEEGKTAEEIVTYYFKDVTVEKVW